MKLLTKYLYPLFLFWIVSLPVHSAMTSDDKVLNAKIPGTWFLDGSEEVKQDTP